MTPKVVLFAPEAEQDLADVYDWIAIRAGPATAIGYVERLHGACVSLALASERGTRRYDIRPGLRTNGFERRITIAFAVGDQTVTILRIFSGGRDWEAVLS